MNEISCRICAHTTHEPVLSDYRALGISWSLFRCLHCGFVTTYPLPDAATLSRAYSENYWDTGTDKAVGAFYTLRMKGFARKLRKTALTGNRALDVGAGTGAWVRLLLTQGFDAVGIDPYANPSLQEMVIKSTIENAPFGPESLDLVTFMHVLEHLEDPVRSLRQAGNLLKTGGLLAIEVPNIESLGFILRRSRWYPLDDIPSHLNHFSVRSLVQTVEQAGHFKTVLNSGFSLRDSPSIMANSLFPNLAPRKVRKRFGAHYPSAMKLLYFAAQAVCAPAVWLSAQAGYGEVLRVVLKKL